MLRRATAVEILVRYWVHTTEPSSDGDSGIFPPEFFTRCFQTSIHVPALPTTPNFVFQLKLSGKPFHIRATQLMWDDFAKRYVASHESVGLPENEYQALLKRFSADTDWKEYSVP